MIHVCWLSYYPNVPKRGYWDNGLHEMLLAGYQHVYELSDIPAGEGAIICLPAKAHEHDAARLNKDLAAFPWVLLILAEDECGDFNTDKLQHPNMKVWVQTPWLGRYNRVDHPLPVGHRIDRPKPMLKLAKDLDWFFCGQITHTRRQQCARQLRNMQGGHLVETSVFGARPDEGGMSYPDYLAAMARAKVIPCPSGNVTPDSFRAWEALESGCVPIVDGLSPRPDFPPGYWDVVAPGHPFPVVEDWSMLGFQMAQVLADWDRLAARCGAWWLRFKRDLRVKLEDTLAELGAPQPRQPITVLIPTSPIPDHPSTAHIVETVNSIRQYAELANAEIIISCDGIRPEQEDLRGRYLEYIRDLLWLAHHEWSKVLVVVHDEHLHQVEMCRRALPLVRTESILYVEHDTPMCDPVPWAGMVAALEELDVVRFYHETAIPHEHGYLHRGDLTVGGHHFERTIQWSQRPHLARAAWYKEMLDAYFSAEARTFIEDKMHSVAQSPRWQGRIGIYLPEGEGIRRSRHTDGRGGAPKFDGGLIF